jgi:excinuclease UvrABC nuclease subunit
VTHETMPERGCLHYHLGLCPGPEEGAITSAQYKRRHIRPLMMYLGGKRDQLMQQLDKDMRTSAKKHDYEAAARARNQLRDLKALSKQMIFGDKESFDLSRDQALVGLAERLGLKGEPRRIECFDISHTQGSDNVASMIVFQDGVPHREEYRRFKMRLRGNDDFAHMREVVARRFARSGAEGWAKPDLIIIDGGKGQLSGALSVLQELGIEIPAVGLAKREEEIIRQQAGEFETIVLPRDSHVLHLLQRVRDEAHRFAVTYHALLRSKRQTRSQLDSVPGIGPATRKKLIKQFGSVAGVKAASAQELAAVVGAAKADLLQAHLAG